MTRHLFQSIVLLFTLLSVHAATGQDVLSQQVPLTIQGGTLAGALHQLEEATGLTFAYLNNVLEAEAAVTCQATATVRTHLDALLGPGYQYKVLGSKVVIKKKAAPRKPGAAKGGGTMALSGTVTDASSGEQLIGATLQVLEANAALATNVYGYYAFSLPPGPYTLEVRFVGYAVQRLNVNLTANQTLNIGLQADETVLQEVVVEASAESPTQTVQMSSHRLSIEAIKRQPAFLGEVDVLSSITLLPGVSKLGEGSPGFHVRGGAADQNLVLLDEAYVYNPSHLLGFFSVFNPDALRDVQLYTGGMPARFGGRASSVLDIRQKEGSMERFKGTGGIGLVSSRLTVEGPIKKGKASFLVAGRRTYADLLYNALRNRSNNEDVSIYFYDLNTKLNYKIDDRNHLYLSGYFGEDVSKLDQSFSFRWGNTTGTLRYNRIINPKLFANFSFIYSNYRYRLGEVDNLYDFDWISELRDYQGKGELTWFANNRLTLHAGFSAIWHRLEPGRIRERDSEEGLNDSYRVQTERALEPAVFVEAEHKVTDRLTLRYGLRGSGWLAYGPLDVYQYSTPVPRNENEITDTVRYSGGQVIEQFYNAEPRFSAHYSLRNSQAVKLSYQRTVQYQHLVSNTTNATPLDIWKGSGPYISPLRSQQIAAGYYRDWREGDWHFSAEAYYKRMEDLLEYRDGAELILTNTLETQLLQGRGRAYGLELQLKKQYGRLQGQLSYTLARTERKVQGADFTETVNQGRWYAANYDKTHDATASLHLNLNKKLRLSALFQYATGRPATFPDGRYQFEGTVIPNYGARNGERLPNYHRLDLSLDIQNKHRPGSRWRSYWNVSIYNLYGRRNAYSIFFRQNEVQTLQTEARRLSILGFVFPSVSYNIEF